MKPAQTDDFRTPDIKDTGELALTSVAPRAPVPADALGASCAVHPEKPAVDTCTRCGNFVCEDCDHVFDGRDDSFCADCANRLEPWELGTSVAWEDRSASLFLRYVMTVKTLLRIPSDFFRQLPARGYLPAISFVYVTELLAFPLGILYVSAAIKAGQAPAGAAVGNGALATALTSLLAPLWVLIFAGMAHAHLRLLGRRANLEMLFRAFGYLAPLSIVVWVTGVISFEPQFALLGILGSVATLVWLLVLSVKALKITHGVGTGIALFAVLLPAIELGLLHYFVLAKVTGLGRMFITPL